MKQLSQLLHEQVYPLVRTGFSSLDERIPFLRKGMLTILAARPAMGKTTLALQIAGNAAAEGKTVAFFTQQKSAFDLSLQLTEIMFIPEQPELQLFIEDRISNIQYMADVLHAAECAPDLVVVDPLQDFYWKSSNSRKKKLLKAIPWDPCGSQGNRFYLPSISGLFLPRAARYTDAPRMTPSAKWANGAAKTAKITDILSTPFPVV